MQITVRVNGILVQKLGSARLSISLPPKATVHDLQQQLQQTHPHAAAELARAVAVVGGVHQSSTAVLQAGQEVALLMPVAGGCGR